MKNTKIGDTLKHKKSGNEWKITFIGERIYAENEQSKICPLRTNKEFEVINI